MQKTLDRIREHRPKQKAPPSKSKVVTVGLRDANGKVHPVRMSRRDLVRRTMAATVAKQTLHLADNVHINEAGKNIELDHQWRQIYADPSPDMRVIAPAQRGKTLYELVKTMAQLSLGLAVGWVMPKKAKVRELVHGKLDPTIKNTPAYREVVGGSGGTDTVAFKTFGDYGRLYIVTCNSTDELTSFTADAMHVDERDFCNRTNLPMYPSRMSRSDYALSDEISTPTLEGRATRVGVRGIDNIHSEFLAGDQLRFHTPCPHCGHWQILDWYRNIVTVELDESGRIVKFDVLDQDWSPGSAMDLRVVCEKCRYPFDRTTPGRWAAVMPGMLMRTYWVEALASEHGPNMATLLDRFSKALGNPTKMQHFHNLDLGRTYSGGMLRFTEDLVNRCVIKGHRMLQSCDQPCTIGIDVNRPWMDVQISIYPDGKQTKIYTEKIQGGKETILALTKRFNIKGGVIDAQPETTYAREIQTELEEMGIPLILCKYATSPMTKLYIVSEAGDNPKLDPPRLITADRTIAIDTVFELMQKGGIAWFEEWAEVLNGALLDEFMTPVRTLSVNEKTGIERFAWEGKPDHAVHVSVLELLAAELLGMTINRDFSMLGPFMSPLMHTMPTTQDSRQIVTPDAVRLLDDDVMIFRG